MLKLCLNPGVQFSSTVATVTTDQQYTLVYSSDPAICVDGVAYKTDHPESLAFYDPEFAGHTNNALGGTSIHREGGTGTGGTYVVTRIDIVIVLNYDLSKF